MENNQRNNIVILIGKISGIKSNQIPKKDGSGTFDKAEFTVIIPRNGAKDGKVDRIGCEAWGKLAIFVLDNLGEDMMVRVEGNFYTDFWEDRKLKASGAKYCFKRKDYVNVTSIKIIDDGVQENDNSIVDEEQQESVGDLPF